MGKKQLTNQDFIQKFENHYGLEYDLSKVKYKTSNDYVIIVCKKHGDRRVIPFNLFKSFMPPCTLCKNELIGFYVTDTASFIKKANIIHNNKYDYTKTIYADNKTKVTITCLEHGDFNITVDGHLVSERGCPICAKNNIKLNNKDILTKFNIIHNNKYKYPNFSHNTVYDYINIECPEHGLFSQKTMLHLRGHGCPKCADIVYSTEDFIKKSKHKYPNKFEYNKTIYKKYNENIIIKCNIHGDIIQTPANHFLVGCPGCNTLEKNKLYLKQFIEKANIIHDNKYDYSKSKYEGRFSKTQIICSIHGDFFQSVGDHLQGCGCPKCAHENMYFHSSYENEIIKFISSIYKKEIIQGYRIENKEIDIYLPDLNWGMEINGSYWHSHLHKSKEYHFEKNKLFNKYNINIFHIWEHDWINPIKKEIIKSMICNKLKLNKDKIYARKCEIKEITSNTYKEFCNKNHIQGHSPTSIKLGLFYNNNLVSCMGFSTLRMNLGNNNTENEYELIRFCNKLNTNVVGGASKLLKHFIKLYAPKSIVSYANEDYSQGNLYKILGFEDKGISNISYNYFNPKTLEYKNRFCYRKSELIKKGYDPNLTEFEITNKMGLYRIYNSGTRKFLIYL